MSEKPKLNYSDQKVITIKVGKVYSLDYTQYEVTKVIVTTPTHQTMLRKILLENEERKIELEGLEIRDIKKGRSDIIQLIPESVRYIKSITKYGAR